MANVISSQKYSQRNIPMIHQKSITLLVLMITILALLAASSGVFSTGGPGPYEYTSIRGETVLVYGQGIYKDMSAEVAPQGIAQDVVTLLIGIPLLLISLYFTCKGSLRGKILLAGSLGYFLVTYLFYLVMGMFNRFYLIYVILLGSSFFALALTMLSLYSEEIHTRFNPKLPTKFLGGFLIFNSLAIGSLWLQIVLPSLLYGVIPKEVEHYTTLIVQGLDLGLLLPLSFLSGALLIKKRPFGYLLAPVYYIFLSILMSALTAKIIAMALLGINVIPVIVIIPTITLITMSCAAVILRYVSQE